MLMPSIFGENLLDDFFDYPFGRSSTFDMMNTDIKDTDAGYEITMNMPGVKKEDVKAELKDGYLTIRATANTSKDEKGSDGRYIRRERYAGAMQRSFYVGEDITHEDIKARFEDGILKLSIPKKDPQVVETKKHIAIEG